MNFTFTNFVEFIKIFPTITFALPRDSKDAEFSKVIMKATVDLCRIQEGVRGNFVIKMIMEQFENISNIVKCPLKPKTVDYWNLKVNETFIPSYLLKKDLKFMIEHKVKAKISSSKTLVYIYTLRVVGEVTKSSENIFPSLF